MRRQPREDIEPPALTVKYREDVGTHDPASVGDLGEDALVRLTTGEWRKIGEHGALGRDGVSKTGQIRAVLIQRHARLEVVRVGDDHDIGDSEIDERQLITQDARGLRGARHVGDVHGPAGPRLDVVSNPADVPVHRVISTDRLHRRVAEGDEPDRTLRHRLAGAVAPVRGMTIRADRGVRDVRGDEQNKRTDNNKDKTGSATHLT